MTPGLPLQIHTHLAQKQQLQQHVEPQPMEEQPFLYKTTSGTFIWETNCLFRIITYVPKHSIDYLLNICILVCQVQVAWSMRPKSRTILVLVQVYLFWYNEA